MCEAEGEGGKKEGVVSWLGLFFSKERENDNYYF